MTLNISVPTTTQELRPKITVIGVGGAGGNAVNNMISANLEGVDFLVANTDGQALAASLADRKIQLGRQQTQGLGAGSAPEIGRVAAQESLDDILAELTDSHMVFITAGMGGGTGTGAAPVIAKAARERGILTVGVVTKPFDFEGPVRMRQANSGIEELQAYVDTLIIIPNQNLFRLANERTTLADAFAMADDVLHKGVSGVTDLMIKPGNINLDFADIRAVMSEMGKAMMGTGEASGDNRAANAAEAAINNPLLDETTMNGAQAVLINITGGPDMTLFEVDEAANHIRREVDTEATIIFGSAIDDRMEGIMRVSVVATGMEGEAKSERPPFNQHVAKPLQPVSQQIETPAPDMIETPVMAETTAMEDQSDMMMDTPSFIMSEADETIEDHAGDMMAEGDLHLDDNIDTDETVMDTDLLDDTDDLTDQHDDDQHDLVALVDQARAEMQSEMAEPEAETMAVSEETDEDLQDDEPFTLRDITNIPEETSEEDAKKTVSLIGHLTGMFSSKKPVEDTPKVEPEVTSTLAADDTVSVMSMATPSMETASPAMERAVGTEVSENTSMDAEMSSEPAAQTEVQPSATPEAKPTGLAALKPTPQPKLDIDDAHADVDLDIPAFLRRQAN